MSINPETLTVYGLISELQRLVKERKLSANAAVIHSSDQEGNNIGSITEKSLQYGIEDGGKVLRICPWEDMED